MTNEPSVKHGNPIVAIATIVGSMATFFGALSFFSSQLGLGIPAIAIGVGIVAAVVFVQRGDITPTQAIATAGAIGVLLLFIYLILSQDAVVAGQVLQDNGDPHVGLAIVLTNANGVDQKSITDKDGQFQIANVPEGRYTITSNGRLLYAGNVPSGLQRIFSPVVNTGGLPFSLILTPINTPVGIPTVTSNVPTLSLTSTPYATSTAFSSITPVLTNTPISTATRTPTMTPTSFPTSGVVADALVTFRDDFDGSSLSYRWDVWNLMPEVKNGFMDFEGRGSWEDGIVRGGIEENEGILILFQPTSILYMEINLNKGDFLNNTWRRWSFFNWNRWEIAAFYNSRDSQSYTYSSPTIRANTWYYLLMRIGDKGYCYTQIWEKDATRFLVNIETAPPTGDGWDNGIWDFAVKVNTGTFRADLYEELQFPPDYLMLTTPPRE